MYSDPIRLYIVGPIKVLFTIILIPAFIGIILFIRDRHVKYVYVYSVDQCHSRFE